MVKWFIKIYNKTSELVVNFNLILINKILIQSKTDP